MPKARKRKDTQFETSMTKSVFLYGRPNKSKSAMLSKMQERFTELVNNNIALITNTSGITMQIVMNDKKNSDMRELEKTTRPEGINSAFCQNAFDMAITHLSNRMENIRQDMYKEDQNVFTSSKILFAMSVEGASKQDMLSAMQTVCDSTKKNKQFYEDCITALSDMSDCEFTFCQSEFSAIYEDISATYKIPHIKRAEMPLDSRLMRIEKSNNIKAPYVIFISDALNKNGKRSDIPIETSRHSLYKIEHNKMAGTVMASMDNGVLKIGWSYTKSVEQPKTANVVGVDVGIVDTMHTSDDKVIGSMKPVLDFYRDVVEKSFASLSDMRNKKNKIKHYLHRHDLPEDVRRSLIQRMDRLDSMIQKAEAPYRKNRRYHAMLDEEIAGAVSGYIKSIGHDTLTSLEKLDIKEFNKSHKANGMMSTFARGKLQQKLMEALNWYGYDFIEVEPDYTSQVCPVCSHLDKENRSGKVFKCKCCGYQADADYVGSLNIKTRAEDKKILEVCEKYKYKHTDMQNHIKMVYSARNAEYLKANKAHTAA